MRFLSKVAGQEKTNKMNAKGLAVVLSPNLLRNPGGDPIIFKVAYPQQCMLQFAALYRRTRSNAKIALTARDRRRLLALRARRTCGRCVV